MNMPNRLAMKSSTYFLAVWIEGSTALFTWALRTMVPKKKINENKIVFMT
jgi:hypothetical protein